MRGSVFLSVVLLVVVIDDDDDDVIAYKDEIGAFGWVSWMFVFVYIWFVTLCCSYHHLYFHA
jgi:hypothetical protein